MEGRSVLLRAWGRGTDVFVGRARSLASFQVKRERRNPFLSGTWGKAEGDGVKPRLQGTFGKEDGQLFLWDRRGRKVCKWPPWGRWECAKSGFPGGTVQDWLHWTLWRALLGIGHFVNITGTVKLAADYLSDLYWHLKAEVNLPVYPWNGVWRPGLLGSKSSRGVNSIWVGFFLSDHPFGSLLPPSPLVFSPLSMFKLGFKLWIELEQFSHAESTPNH